MTRTDASAAAESRRGLAVADTIVVGCGQAKAQSPAAARDLYVGSLFRAARRAAEADGRRWLILSAAHGLIDPGMVLAPYERRLRTTDADLDRLAGLVHAQQPPAHVESWAAARYTEALRRAGVQVVSAPLAGQGLGAQIGWLTRWARSAESFTARNARRPGPQITDRAGLSDTGLVYAGSLTEHRGIPVVRIVSYHPMQLLAGPVAVQLANGVALHHVDPAHLVPDPLRTRTPTTSGHLDHDPLAGDPVGGDPLDLDAAPDGAAPIPGRTLT
jgi:hypothetical protein